MKGLPCKLTSRRFEVCKPEEADHLCMRIPGPTGQLMLPVMIGGTRAGTSNWTWNGDTEKVTLKPSVKTTMSKKAPNDTICHSFINDGVVKFLDDCTHELRNTEVPLMDIDESVLNRYH